jgi:hypothetical protein
MRFLRLLHPTGRSGFNSWPKSAAPLLQPLLSKESTNDLQIAPKIDCNTNDRCFVLFLVIQPEAIGRGGDAVVVADIPAKVRERGGWFSSDKGSSQLAINCRFNLNSCID